MANPFGTLMFTDNLAFPTVVDASAGGVFDFDVVPAKACLHSLLPPATQDNCWTIVPADSVTPGASVNSYLGPLVVAQKGVAITATWRNLTSPGAVQAPPPIAVIRPVYTMDPGKWVAPAGLSMHLHGGKLLGSDDGWPVEEVAPGNTQTCNYPNDQAANLIWFHDHAMDWTARNVYAGIAGGYLIRDQFDDRLMALIPAANEIPLVFQDRQLWDPALNKLESIMRYDIDSDPGSPGGLTRQAPYGVDSNGVAGQIDVLPELIGEFNLVNGKLWPKHGLPARDLYRLRMINGCNARTYALRLVGKVGGIWTYLNNLLHVIGTDGGFLGAAVALKAKEALVIAPGERFDVVMDLRNLRVDVVNGEAQLFLVNTAGVPYASDAVSSAVLPASPLPTDVLAGAATVESAPFNQFLQGFPQIMRFDVNMTAPRQARAGFTSVDLPVLMIQARAAVQNFRYRSVLGWQANTGVNFGQNRVFLIDNVMQGMQMAGQNVGMMYLRECERLPSAANADLVLRWDVDTTAGRLNPAKAATSIKDVGYSFDARMGPMSMDNDTFQQSLRLGAPQPGSYERWYFINFYPNAGALLPNPLPTLPLDMHPVHIHLVNFLPGQALEYCWH